MGKGISLSELVEWRIGANKKQKDVAVSRVVERLGDYVSELNEVPSRYRVKKTASIANL